MSIVTEKGSYISDTEGMLLTDGMSFGVEYFLGDGRSADELKEISREEYEALTMTDVEVTKWKR